MTESTRRTVIVSLRPGESVVIMPTDLRDRWAVKNYPSYDATVLAASLSKEQAL